MNYITKTTLNPQFHCETENLKSGAKTVTDLSQEKGGKGTSFSPPELVTAALCSCMLSMIQYTAASRGINISSAQAQGAVEEENGTIISIHISFSIPLPSSTEGRTIIERAAEHCPVHKSLDKSVKITTEWHWE